jgi:hypothetical protein
VHSEAYTRYSTPRYTLRQRDSSGGEEAAVKELLLNGVHPPFCRPGLLVIFPMYFFWQSRASGGKSPP